MDEAKATEWFEQFKAERQIELVGYGGLLSSLAKGVGYVARQLAWIIDVRRLAIVVIIFLGLSLVAYLAVKELAFRRAQKESRCQRIKDQFGRTNQATAILSKNDASLMTISYDMRAKLSRTECGCATGNVLNTFWFKQFDFKSKAITNGSVHCMCDTDYALQPGNVVYTGDPKLIQFMQTGDPDDAKAVFGLVAQNSVLGSATSYLTTLTYTAPDTAASTITVPNAQSPAADLAALQFMVPMDLVTLSSVSYLVTYTANTAGGGGLAMLSACIVDAATLTPVANSLSTAATRSTASGVAVVPANSGTVTGTFLFNSPDLVLALGTKYCMSFTWAIAPNTATLPLQLKTAITINYQKSNLLNNLPATAKGASRVSGL